MAQKPKKTDEVHDERKELNEEEARGVIGGGGGFTVIQYNNCETQRTVDRLNYASGTGE